MYTTRMLAEPLADTGIINEIAAVYCDAFSGPTWNETWEPSQVIADFRREMSRPAAFCTVAQSAGRVIGFAWGYDVIPSERLSESLAAPRLEQRIAGTHCYLDELAVLTERQSQGIGKKLLRDVLAHRGERPLLLRTKEHSWMRALVESHTGDILMRISQERVIMRIA